MRSVAVLAGVLGGGYALSLAIGPSAVSAAGVPPSVIGSGGNGFATVTVDAHNTGTGTAATGWFTATGDLAKIASPTLALPLGALGTFHFAGPVTCLDIQGNRAGLIYPITTASGAIGQFAKGMAVYITIVDAGPGKPDSIGFVGPAPISSLTACPPAATFLTATSGDVVVTDGD